MWVFVEFVYGMGVWLRRGGFLQNTLKVDFINGTFCFVLFFFCLYQSFFPENGWEVGNASFLFIIFSNLQYVQSCITPCITMFDFMIIHVILHILPSYWETSSNDYFTIPYQSYETRNEKLSEKWAPKRNWLRLRYISPCISHMTASNNVFNHLQHIFPIL